MAGLDGPNQLALLLAAAVALGVGVVNGHNFEDLMKHVVKSISLALGAILILLLIGALTGTWLISGIIPAMIHHGLLLLSPKIFLMAACVVCAIVSLATGSSWSTVATVGIALLGIGKAMGFHEGLVAGAVISGAYFGDKLSPLSDTTNLAPAVAGTDLFTHIRYLLWTTVPSMVIALLLFTGIGLFREASTEVLDTGAFHAAILSKFNIAWWTVPGAFGHDRYDRPQGARVTSTFCWCAIGRAVRDHLPAPIDQGAIEQGRGRFPSRLRSDNERHGAGHCRGHRP
jgi:Na+:H+ antiporter, NhaC family